ncbi:MAG: DEAD/DEAH box helicase family protein [Thaumarchaeota archaeon]|nr:DEAD/DEAH box helicase family protein [Nitrososphaerota archaeon]
MHLIRGEPEFEAEGVYRWTDWPERERLIRLDGKDIGIDLVVRLKSGEWVAVQCKCYDDEKYRVEKKDIDSFLAVSGRDPFGFRWIVATCGWSANAEAEIGGQKIPVSRIDFQKYARVRVDASSPEARPDRDIWPAQEDAVSSVADGLLAYDRGQLVMACGTGKTFTSLRISERHVKTGGRILFLAPSIALVSQARTEWLRHCTRPMRTLLVCSDSTAGRSSDEDIGISELACRVTTDPEKIAQELKSLNGSTTAAVFCTYQSLYQVSRAQYDYGAPAFDLAVADEAHRTTGVDRGSLVDDDTGRGKKRNSS